MRDGIFIWEAHRGGGGGYEMPESCKLSFEYGWLHGGRPEADVNLTSDNVMVSLHDPNLNRIARNLPEQYKDKPITEISWAELQTIDIGSMVNDLDETIKNVQNSDAFTIATEPERQSDGLHFIAQIDVAKIMAQVDESELNELNEAASEMAPGMDVVELLKGMKPINVEIVCDDNYDPKSILIDAKDTIQTLADIVIEGFVNQMAASMAASDETTEGQQVDFNEFIKLKINSLVWNLYSLQLLPSGSVVIEVPEEALNAVEDETNGLIMDNDYDSSESYDVSNDGFGE